MENMFEGNIVFPVLLFSTVSDLSNVYMMGQSSSFDMVLFSFQSLTLLVISAL